MKMKRILMGVVAAALSMSMVYMAMATSFTDVPASHWAYSSIEKAASNNWVSGTGNGKFEPDGAMTGAQWLTMVVRVFYGDEVLGGHSVTWYIPYVTVADAHKLRENADMDSLYDGLNKNMNRYQMAVVMTNVLKDKGVTATEAQKEKAKAQIPDWNSIPSKYQDAVATASGLGLIAGVDERGTFNGTQGMTRAQAAVILCRLEEAFSLASNGDQNNSSDNNGDKTDKNPDVTEKDPTPEQKPSSGSKVGTLSDTPVTLSYATHAPIVDYWSSAPADVKEITDKDAFNAAVQSLKDQKMIRDPKTLVKGVNPYYNYAVFQRDGSEKQINVTASVAQMSAAGTGLNAQTKTINGEKVGFITSGYTKDVHDVIDPIISNMPSGSDLEKSEYFVKAVCDRIDYKINGGADWTNGKTIGDCNDYRNMIAALFNAAGIPQFSYGQYNHAWLYVYLDGNWYVCDPSAADIGAGGATESTIKAAAHMDENYYGDTSGIRSYQIAKALVKAAYEQ